MNIVKLNQGETYQPDPGWKRISLAGSSNVSIEYFEKPPGHTSPLHHHANEQVCIVMKDKMKVVNGNGEEDELGPGDGYYLVCNPQE